MKKINKTLYTFITFVLIWLIISLPNNTVFIENWDISGIFALFSFYATALFIILPSSTNDFSIDILPFILSLIISTIIIYVVLALCSLNINCINWSIEIKIIFCAVTLVTNTIVLLICFIE